METRCENTGLKQALFLPVEVVSIALFDEHLAGFIFQNCFLLI